MRDIEVKVVKYQDELEACRKSGDSKITDEAIAKVRKEFVGFECFSVILSVDVTKSRFTKSRYELM